MSQEAMPGPGTQTVEPPLEFLRNPSGRQSPSLSGHNISGSVEDMSNLSNMHYGEDSRSVYGLIGNNGMQLMREKTI